MGDLQSCHAIFQTRTQTTNKKGVCAILPNAETLGFPRAILMNKKDKLEFFAEVFIPVVVGVLALEAAVYLLIERL